uniref:Uncharacterized protein n=1 Tax=Anguilla anguilla TaxID=7936 RepID=A0A0E9W254_ANGAN
MSHGTRIDPAREM